MTIKVPSSNLIVEGAQITFRNFAGAPTPFDPVGGKRGFSLIIGSREEAEALVEQGWKIKFPKPREDGEDPRYAATMPISIKYHPRLQPPRVRMITSRGQTVMGEEDIDVLDFMSIKSVDMIIRPFKWEFNGNEGVKNMLQSIYITIEEDELEQKYSYLPEIGPGGAQLAIESGDAEILEDLGEHRQLQLERGF